MDHHIDFLRMDKDILSCSGPEIMDRLSLLSPRPDSDDWKTELLTCLGKQEQTNLKEEGPRVITVRNEDAGMDGWRVGYMGDNVPIEMATEEAPLLQETDEVITELTLNVVDVPATMDGTWTLNNTPTPQSESYPAWLVEGRQEPLLKKKVLKPKKLNVSLPSHAMVSDIINTPTLEDMIGDTLDTPRNNILKWVIDETIAPDEAFPGMLTEQDENTKPPPILLPKPKAKKREMPWIVAEPEPKARKKLMPTKLAEYSVDMPWIKPEPALKERKREIPSKLAEYSLPDWLKKEGLKDDYRPSPTTVNTNDIIFPADDILPQFDTNAGNDNQGETVIKRKRGRPSKTTTPFITPKLPRQRRTKSVKSLSDDHSYVNEENRDDMKYRRMRDLNNEASRKCRIRRKDKFSIVLEEKEELIVRNNNLKEKMTLMETEVAAWKEKVDLKAANNAIINSSEIASIDAGLAAVTSHDDVAALFYGSSFGPEVSTMESTWALNM